MKQRLPRKYKKQVKKKVAAMNASKVLRSAMASMMAATQLAMISSYPMQTSPAEKAMSVAGLVVDTAKSISTIMSEKPNSWRDFIR